MPDEGQAIVAFSKGPPAERVMISVSSPGHRPHGADPLVRDRRCQPQPEWKQMSTDLASLTPGAVQALAGACSGRRTMSKPADLKIPADCAHPATRRSRAWAGPGHLGGGGRKARESRGGRG